MGYTLLSLGMRLGSILGKDVAGGARRLSPGQHPHTKTHIEKCASLQKGGWAMCYVPNAPVMTFEEVAVFLSDCVVRNMNLLLNVAPDREGVIPKNQQDVLLKTGQWLEKIGPANYNTRSGPWQPRHGEYGFTYAVNDIYGLIYVDYRDNAKGIFTTQSIGSKKVGKVTDIYSGKELPWKKNTDNTITIGQLDYNQTPCVTILQVTLTSASVPDQRYQ
jgi:alpha-L-fucosidase